MEPYAPRELRNWGVRRNGEWMLKVYSVLYGSGTIHWDGFEPGIRMAEAALPEPDEDAGRLGLGFLIAHQGKTGDYVVLAWWDAENELPIRVWVRRDRSQDWRPARGGESVCVWDLEIVWAEREAWVSTMMASPDAGIGSYLTAVDARFLG